ncbi:MAG: pyridoxamine 5'-phosphate oxidase family protein [Usitatibacter sp.]
MVHAPQRDLAAFGVKPVDPLICSGPGAGAHVRAAYLGKNLAKLDDAEIAANCNGGSRDPKADAAVRFAAKVARERGHVADSDLQAVRLAGYDDAQIIEIVLHVALNTWTNYVNEVAGTEVDFHDECLLATASADGPPYIQHRGGPPGFLHVLDEQPIAFVDFAGNRQFITQGNLSENPRAQLFLIDCARRQRIKIWGTARVVEGDPDLTARLMPPGYIARPEQVIVFNVAAWDVNCPQHIPQRFEAADVAAAAEQRDKRIAELEGELRLLRER